MGFSPLTSDNNSSILVVGAWDKTISFYNCEGYQEMQSKQLDFNPVSIKWLKNSDFFVLTGTNNQA